MAMVRSSITWLCRSWGSKAMALPHRLGQGDGADVDGIRDPVAHRDVERGDGLDVHRAAGDPDAHLRDHRRVPSARRSRARRPRSHVSPARRSDARQPGVGRQRLGDLVEDVGPDVAVRVDAADDVDLLDERVADPLRLALLRDHGVEPLLLDPHGVELRLEYPEPRALRDEQQQPTADDHHRGAAGRQQPGVLDAGDQAPEIGQRELEARARCRLLRLLAGKQVYFDHAARLSASPTESIRSGATSSTATDSNTASRTLRRCTGLASSTATRSRAASASFSPGIRAPPPIVYTRPSPPAERDAVCRNAAARSTPTAISSPRAST